MGPERLQTGIEHFERWQATRSPADLASAIADLSALDADLPAVHDLRLPVDMVLMLALDARYQLTDSMDDLDGVIERLRRIVALPDPPPDFAVYRVVLGRALYNRINMYGQPGGPRPIPDAEFLVELRTAVDGLAVAQRAGVNLVSPDERAQAAAMRAHLIPKLVWTQAIVDRKAKRTVDPGEIERVLRDLPADHPNRAQLILEAGIAHMAQVLLAPGRGGSFTTSEHRVPAARYLSQAVELLNPDYPERPKALAFLSFLAFTRRPDSPDATAAGPVQPLVSEAIGATGLDQVLGAVLRLMAGTSVNPGSSAADVEQAVARLNEAMDLAGDPRGERSRARDSQGAAVGDPGRVQGLAQHSVHVLAEPGRPRRRGRLRPAATGGPAGPARAGRGRVPATRADRSAGPPGLPVGASGQRPAA